MNLCPMTRQCDTVSRMNAEHVHVFHADCSVLDKQRQRIESLGIIKSTALHLMPWS